MLLCHRAVDGACRWCVFVVAVAFNCMRTYWLIQRCFQLNSIGTRTVANEYIHERNAFYMILKDRQTHSVLCDCMAMWMCANSTVGSMRIDDQVFA